jgi:hypothetical protein
MGNEGKKDPRAEAAAENFLREKKVMGSFNRQVRTEAFLAGVSWKEADLTPHKQSVEMRFADIANGRDTPTPQAADVKTPSSTVWVSQRTRIWYPSEERARFSFGDDEKFTPYVPESAISQARAEARAEAFSEILNWASPTVDALVNYAEDEMNAAKAPVEPAKAAGSPNGAGEEKEG